MTDLTKITTPFGLLDEETQRALEECGETLEFFGVAGWESSEELGFTDWLTYRQKPQPREYVAWQVVHLNGDRSGFPCLNEQTAQLAARQIGGRVIKLTGRDDDRA